MIGTAFMANALGHSLGFASLTGGAIRLKGYGDSGCTAGEVGQIVFHTTTGFLLGAWALAASPRRWCRSSWRPCFGAGWGCGARWGSRRSRRCSRCCWRCERGRSGAMAQVSPHAALAPRREPGACSQPRGARLRRRRTLRAAARCGGGELRQFHRPVSHRGARGPHLDGPGGTRRVRMDTVALSAAGEYERAAPHRYSSTASSFTSCRS